MNQSSEKNKKMLSQMSQEEQFEEGIRIALEIARETFNPEDEELPFGLALINKDYNTGENLEKAGLAYLAYDPTFLNSWAMKQQLIQKIQDFTKKSDAEYMIFACRAWAAEIPKEDININSRINVSERPDKKEIKIVSVDHVTLGSRTYVADIKPNKEGKLELGEFERVDMGSGLMVGNFFDRKAN